MVSNLNFAYISFRVLFYSNSLIYHRGVLFFKTEEVENELELLGQKLFSLAEAQVYGGLKQGLNCWKDKIFTTF